MPEETSPSTAELARDAPESGDGRVGAAAGRGGASDRGAEGERSYGEILAEEIRKGLAELERPAGGLVLSGLSAGMDVGFSVFLMAAGLTVMGGELSGPVVHLLLANMYAVGFVFVILGRSELFTEHTTLAVFPVLGRRARIRDLARLWGLVYGANLVGAALFALLLSFLAPPLDVIVPSAFGVIAETMTDHPSWVIFVSAVLAGWLMGLLSWLVAAGRDTTSQLLVVWLVTASIGFGQLHHCIVGSVEVLVGLFSGQGVTVYEYFRFLLWATLGNAAGGVTFVALIKYSHAVKGSRGEEG